jgi:dsRNA-specific ribonuclease
MWYHVHVCMCGMQAVEEKLQEKEADESCRHKSVVEFLVSITNSSTGWSCMDHPKSVADVFEALVGAAFLDSGEDLVTAFNVRATCVLSRDLKP